ncbi:MAG TPA: low specificity L-threonine aldolase [Beijerinckiaceae bacterium]|nr:low specificity L-threonine aldolase [Beijerinckiaceae bacterium]
MAGRVLNFASDNVVGASDKVLQAIVSANGGALASYGADTITKRVEHRLNALFERDCQTFLVTTGTAANALAIACLSPPHGAVLCHEEAHSIDDECGAPEFFMGGGKLVGIAGAGAKLTRKAILDHLAAEPGGTRHPPIRGLSISQATECGTVYSLAEIAEVSRAAHDNGMHVHMDGARFANALLHLGCAPAEMTWKAGIDILSFGGTKNGCLMAEAVVFFNPALAEDFAFKRKRAGQTVSKGRLLAAQFDAYLGDDHWLDLARHANAMADRLAGGLTAIPGLRLAWPTDANEVFCIMPEALYESLKARDVVFYDWTDKSLPRDNRLKKGEVVTRLICSFATAQKDVDALLRLARTLAG